jgi:hypothetical protein
MPTRWIPSTTSSSIAAKPSGRACRFTTRSKIRGCGYRSPEGHRTTNGAKKAAWVGGNRPRRCTPSSRCSSLWICPTW